MLRNTMGLSLLAADRYCRDWRRLTSMSRSNTLDPGWKPTEANGNASILGERGKSNNPLLGERGHNPLLGERAHSNNRLLGERGHNPRLQSCNIGRKTYELGQGSSASSSVDVSSKYRPATWLTELEATRAGR